MLLWILLKFVPRSLINKHPALVHRAVTFTQRRMLMRKIFSWDLIRCLPITSSNGNIFRVTGPLWGKSICHRWIPPTKVSKAELNVFFDLHLNKRLSKQPRLRWFETPSRSLWRQYNVERRDNFELNMPILAFHLDYFFIIHIFCRVANNRSFHY